MSRISYRVPKLIFSRGRGEGRLFEGGRLLQILSLRRGANSKRGASLKLGANLSIYGCWYIVPEKSTHYLSNRKVFRVCIAWYKHERGWENSRKLSKPETSFSEVRQSINLKVYKVYRLSHLGKRCLGFA